MADKIFTSLQFPDSEDKYAPRDTTKVSFSEAQALTATEAATARANIGAMPDTYTAPVSSINQKIGAVVLTAKDVDAMANVSVTSDDEGKILRVVNGAWAATTLINAEEETY